LAAHIAVSVIQESMPADAPLPDEAVPTLTQKIVEDWRAAVLSDLEQHPFTPEEWAAVETAEGGTGRVSVEEEPVLAYGATLLVVAAAETFMLYLQLGDGDILAVGASGQTYRPLPGDDRLIGNQTTSLCQPEAWNEFRAIIIRDPAEFAPLVLASTDGYANSFRSDDDFLKIGRDYLNLVREDGLDSLAEDLPDILAEASQKGSGDDITLSILVSDAAYAAPPVVTEVVAETTAVPAAPRPASEQPVAAPAPQQPRPRFSSGQVRILALIVFVVVGGFLVQHYAQGSKQPTPSASAPVPVPPAAPKKSGNAPPQGKEWALSIGAEAPIPLRPGTKITAKHLFGTGDSKPYAEVTEDGEGILKLVNLSDDPWAVERPGKKTEPPRETGYGVEIASGVKITFGHGKSRRLRWTTLDTRHGLAFTARANGGRKRNAIRLRSPRSAWRRWPGRGLSSARGSFRLRTEMVSPRISAGRSAIVGSAQRSDQQRLSLRAVPLAVRSGVASPCGIVFRLPDADPTTRVYQPGGPGTSSKRADLPLTGDRRISTCGKFFFVSTPRDFVTATLTSATFSSSPKPVTSVSATPTTSTSTAVPAASWVPGDSWRPRWAGVSLSPAR
jgi:hypothetical protein